MILSLVFLLLFIFYTSGGFKRLLTAFKLDPDPVQNNLDQQQKTGPAPPNMDREKLEKIARDCLTSSGVKFDTYYYTRNKSDIELMDIIKDYNLNK